MEPEKVKRLLERFYAGETDSEEEALLREFFSQDEVPEEWAAEKAHFQLLRQWQQESPLGDAFDHRIMDQITAPARPPRSFSAWYTLAGVAASVLLVLALWLGNRQDKQTALPGTTRNPALAYVQVRAALQLVSGTLDEGVQPAAKAASEMTGAMRKVATVGTLNAAVKPVRKLSEMERARELMASLNSVYINLKPIKNK